MVFTTRRIVLLLDWSFCNSSTFVHNLNFDVFVYGRSVLSVPCFQFIVSLFYFDLSCGILIVVFHASRFLCSIGCFFGLCSISCQVLRCSCFFKIQELDCIGGLSFYNPRIGLYWCSVFFTIQELDCIAALSFHNPRICVLMVCLLTIQELDYSWALSFLQSKNWIVLGLCLFCKIILHFSYLLSFQTVETGKAQ